MHGAPPARGRLPRGPPPPTLLLSSLPVAEAPASLWRVQVTPKPVALAAPQAHSSREPGRRAPRVSSPTPRVGGSEEQALKRRREREMTRHEVRHGCSLRAPRRSESVGSCQAGSRYSKRPRLRGGDEGPPSQGRGVAQRQGWGPGAPGAPPGSAPVESVPGGGTGTWQRRPPKTAACHHRACAPGGVCGAETGARGQGRRRHRRALDTPAARGLLLVATTGTVLLPGSEPREGAHGRAGWAAREARGAVTSCAPTRTSRKADTFVRKWKQVEPTLSVSDGRHLASLSSDLCPARSRHRPTCLVPNPGGPVR